mmetsp:Transcript_1447/g.2496  ORF Transcript_1447/g.2496 Transcript_1447/m.2496 type:complete len:448 (+) Transcript_1447:17-1360(+)
MPSGNLFTQLAIPLTALALGTLCHCCESGKTLGKLLVYFGSQTCMNLYVKSVLNNTIIVEGLKGIPASFFVTLSQQMISGVLFLMLVIMTHLFGRPYSPRRLVSRLDYVAVVCFSMAFALNIGLNNFSLSMIPLSINLVIRACLPLSTLLSQQLLGPCFGETRKPINPLDLLFMLTGVSCAAVTVVCDYQNPVINDNFVLGVLAATGSVFSGAINMVLAGLLGTSLKMNPLDTTGYMSLPSSIFLAPIVMFMMHPVASSWDKTIFPSPATDWQVIEKVLANAPSKLLLVALFGPIAFAYNMLQWALVQSLSATHTSFAGNANKAATICLALVLGLENLPPDHWGVLKVAAVAGNILAFTAFSVRKEMASRRARILAAQQEQDESPGPLPSQGQLASSYARDSREGSQMALAATFKSQALSSRQSSPRCPSEAMGDSFLDIKEKLDAS